MQSASWTIDPLADVQVIPPRRLTGLPGVAVIVPNRFEPDFSASRGQEFRERFESALEDVLADLFLLRSL